jgi:hypothetical protein
MVSLSALLEGDDDVDVTRFARRATFRRFNLANQVNLYMLPSMSQGSASGALRQHTSFGGVISRPFKSRGAIVEAIQSCNDFYEFAWICWGWGKEKRRYQANAWRKMLGMFDAVFTTGELKDSLQLVDDGYEFWHAVVSKDSDGNFPIGIFPHGGAKIVQIGGLWFVTAVSCLEADEDDAAAGAAALYIGSFMRLHVPKGLRRAQYVLTHVLAA